MLASLGDAVWAARLVHLDGISRDEIERQRDMLGRLTLGEGPEAFVVYLKREAQVRWRTRLANFLAGSGWVSRCVREATVLEALERDGLPGPRWLATGDTIITGTSTSTWVADDLRQLMKAHQVTTKMRLQADYKIRIGEGAGRGRSHRVCGI